MKSAGPVLPEYAGGKTLWKSKIRDQASAKKVLAYRQF